MRFAARTNFSEGDAESPYGRALREARGRGDLVDLTLSNPTGCGFNYCADRLLPGLVDTHVLTYDADPLGMRSAREAIARFYRERYEAVIAPEHLLLTASTSEAYSYLLRLLCEPGDAILVPSPSYPLFDLLARLHDVELVPYPLVYHDGWQIDPASLADAVTPRTRAVVAIHPNNPTGHFCSAHDVGALRAIAQKHDLPLIVDEVFLDYSIEGPGEPSFTATASPGLTFVLGGLSKLVALPQMKLAWTTVRGPAVEVRSALERLEIIADTFLSVGTPPQVALPRWLDECSSMQDQVLSRVRGNLHALDGLLAESPVSRLRVGGGWTAVLRVPAIDPDVELAVRFLREHAVSVHPGSLYGFPDRGWLVISLLPEAAPFLRGVQRLLTHFAI